MLSPAGSTGPRPLCVAPGLGATVTHKAAASGLRIARGAQMLESIDSKARRLACAPRGVVVSLLGTLRGGL